MLARSVVSVGRGDSMIGLQFQHHGPESTFQPTQDASQLLSLIMESYSQYSPQQIIDALQSNLEPTKVEHQNSPGQSNHSMTEEDHQQNTDQTAQQYKLEDQNRREGDIESGLSGLEDEKLSLSLASEAKQEAGFELGMRKDKWTKNSAKEELRRKYDQQKIIAMQFCEHGIDYARILREFPSMSAKNYRCVVETVNNQTINEIVNFLRYEQNINIEKLNRDQKRSMRTQLTKVRQWLGNRDLAQLQTYYQFIRRHYDKQIQITMEQAIKLYKTIIQIIKSPYVNVLDVDEQATADHPDDHAQAPDNAHDQQQRAIIIEYIKSKDLIKVSDALCQRYGYSLRWSTHSISCIFKLLLEKSLRKLVVVLKRAKLGDYWAYFTAQKIQVLASTPLKNLQIKVLSYSLEKRSNLIRVKELLESLLAFFEANGFEKSLPKLQTTLVEIKPEQEDKHQADESPEKEEAQAEKREVGEEEFQLELECESTNN